MTSLSPYADPRPRRVGFLPVLVVSLLVLGLAAYGVTRLPDLLPSLPNPFASETVDRSQPAVLKSLVDLREYRAASGNYQVLVDVEKDYKWLPSFVRGERTLFVANGSVDGLLDFSRLTADNITVSDDRRSVEITLPKAQLGVAHLDADRSYVADRDRGVLDRVGSLVGGTPTDADLYRLAEQKLEQAAAADTELPRRAEQNTRVMLEQMMRALGFDDVTVRFTASPL